MATHIERLMDDIAKAEPRFVAAPKAPLVDGRLYILYHQRGPSRNSLRLAGDYDTISIGDEELRFAGTKHVLPSAVHFEGRVALLSARSPGFGLERLEPNEGLRNLREFLANPTPRPAPPTATVQLDELVDELIESGATAIGAERDVLALSGGTVLSLVVNLPPACGVPIVNQYNAVNAGGHELSLTARFVVDGPVFPGMVPLYASDFLPGTHPIPVEIGLNDIEWSIRTLHQR